MNVGVVGAGLGGLAAACSLATRGHRVTVFDQNAWAGGKAAPLVRDGFRFDMGPTIVTIPSVLQRIFREANRDLADYVALVPLDPQWRSFFDDGATLDLVADETAMREKLNAFSKNARTSDGYARFLDLAKTLHRISANWFFYRSIGGLRDMFDAGNMTQPATLKDLFAMRMGRSVASTVRSFIPDARVAQMVDHFTQYVGSAPDASPAVLCGIAHMQTSEGIWYPLGGTRAIPVALEKLARELGVAFELGRAVARLTKSADTITGIELADGEKFSFDAVVSNADSVRTHRELLGGVRAFDRRRKYEPACSGVVLYLGLRKRFPHLLHHNFVFSRDPHEEFDFIYRKGEPAPDPTCYVCAPAITEPAVAPPGGEALYILVHTPYLRPHHDWKHMLPDYRRVILDKMKRTAGVDLEPEIVTEEALTPQDIHDRYRVLDGAIYGLASHGKFLGAFKPGNRSPDFRNLYLCGGAAHPGPGMPMVMMSGWIAADTLDQDYPAGSKPVAALA
ncbi:MAG: phytoene desaturase family protein [Verrucomicrobiota bacterium]|nr:phytoene desaturase family protein [Verrucomicrobiota bacterium]